MLTILMNSSSILFEEKKKRIILANSNDSQRIGIVVSSLDELKSKGIMYNLLNKICTSRTALSLKKVQNV